jgi:hypothetical protein
MVNLYHKTPRGKRSANTFAEIHGPDDEGKSPWTDDYQYDAPGTGGRVLVCYYPDGNEDQEAITEGSKDPDLTYITMMSAKEMDECINRTLDGPSKQLEYPIAQRLPHLALPVGRTKSEMVFLEGLWDTGGCSTIGWKPFFDRLREKYPSMFRAYHDLKRDRIEPIRIGGIGGRIHITHLCEIYLSYQLDGGPA